MERVDDATPQPVPDATPTGEDAASPVAEPSAPPAEEPVSTEPSSVAALPAIQGHRFRFGLFYLALGAVLTAAIAGVVVIALQPGKPKPKPWAAWSPPSGSTSKVSNEIATHIGGEYRLSPSGSQLVAIFSGTPELAHGLKTMKVSTIAFRASASAQCCSRIIPSTKDVLQDDFCGLGSQCSIQNGTASTTRERLLRREALEIALYTFKYAPAVNSVIAFMPPPPGDAPSTVLYLERANLKRQLSEPLARTLPLATPPAPTSLDGSEATTIDQLTLPAEYSFQYQSLNDGTEAIILTPGAA